MAEDTGALSAGVMAVDFVARWGNVTPEAFRAQMDSITRMGGMVVPSTIAPPTNAASIRSEMKAAVGGAVPIKVRVQGIRTTARAARVTFQKEWEAAGATLPLVLNFSANPASLAKVRETIQTALTAPFSITVATNPLSAASTGSSVMAPRPERRVGFLQDPPRGAGASMMMGGWTPAASAAGFMSGEKGPYRNPLGQYSKTPSGNPGLWMNAPGRQLVPANLNTPNSLFNRFVSPPANFIPLTPGPGLRARYPYSDPAQGSLFASPAPAARFAGDKLGEARRLARNAEMEAAVRGMIRQRAINQELMQQARIDRNAIPYRQRAFQEIERGARNWRAESINQLRTGAPMSTPYSGGQSPGRTRMVSEIINPYYPEMSAATNVENLRGYRAPLTLASRLSPFPENTTAKDIRAGFRSAQAYRDSNALRDADRARYANTAIAERDAAMRRQGVRSNLLGQTNYDPRYLNQNGVTPQVLPFTASQNRMTGYGRFGQVMPNATFTEGRTALMDRMRADPVTALGRSYRALADSMRGVDGALAERATMWHNAAKSYGSQAYRFGAAGGVLMRSIALPAALAAGYGAYESGKLQSTLGKTVALTDIEKKELPGITTGLRGLSKDVPQSVNELAEAFYFVASNGNTASQSMQVVRQSALGAAGGLGKTEDVADTTTSVMAAYGLEASRAAHVTDVLTTAVNIGKGEADKYAGAFAKVIPVASQAGISFEEVAASMAIMTRVGLNPNESATAFRQMTHNLFAPTDEAKKAMKMLGTDPDKIRKDIKGQGLAATLQDLMKASGGNIDILDQLVGNVRGLTGLLATAGSQADEYAAALDRMYNSAGATDKAFKTMSGTAEFQLKRLWNNFKDVFIGIGDRILPAFTDKVRSVADAMPGHMDRIGKAWGNLPEGGKELLKTAGFFLLAAGPALKLTSIILNLRAGLALLGAGIAGKPLLAITALAAGMLILANHFGVTRNMLQGTTAAISGSTDRFSAMSVVVGVISTALITLMSIRWGLAMAGQAQIAIKAIAGVRAAIAAEGGLAVLSRIVTGGAAAKGAGVFTQVSSSGAAMAGGAAAQGGIMGALGIGAAGGAAALAATALAATALTTALMLGATAWQDYKYKMDAAVVQQHNIQMGMKQIASLSDSLSLTATGSGNKGLASAFGNIRGEIAAAEGDPNKLKRIQGSLSSRINQITLDAGMPQSRKDAILSEARQIMAQLKNILQEKIVVQAELDKGFFEGNYPNFVAGGWAAYEIGKNALTGRGLGVDAAVNRGGTFQEIARDLNPIYQAGLAKTSVLDYLTGKNNNPAPVVAPPAYHAMSVGKDRSSRIVDNILGTNSGNADIAKLKETVKEYRDLAKLKKLIKEYDTRPDVQSALKPIIKDVIQRKDALQAQADERQRAMERGEYGINFDAQAEYQRRQEALMRKALQKQETALSGFVSVLDGTMGKVREYTLRTEEARVANELMKDSLAGIDGAAKKGALGLAQLYDKMKNLTEFKDTLRDIFGGWQKTIVEKGGDASRLASRIAPLSRDFNYAGNMTSLQGTAQSMYAPIARDAQARREQLEQDSENLTVSIGGGSALGNKIAGIAYERAAKKQGDDFGRHCLYWAQEVLAKGLPKDELKRISRLSYSKGGAKFTGRALMKSGDARSFDAIGGYSGLRPGDMLFGDGGDYGHTGIYIGNGKVAENNGGKSKVRNKNNIKISNVNNFSHGVDYVYRPGGWGEQPTIGTSVPRNGGGGNELVPMDVDRVRNNTQSDAAAERRTIKARESYEKITIASNAGQFRQAEDSLSQFVPLSKDFLKAMPGSKGMRPKPGNEGRMRIITALQDKKFLESMRQAAAVNKMNLNDLVADMWSIALEFDMDSGRQDAINEHNAAMLELKNRISMVGKEGNPVAAIENEARVSAQRGKPWDNVMLNTRKAGAMQEWIANSREQTRLSVRVSNDKARALQIAAPSMGSPRIYQRELDLANLRLQLQNEFEPMRKQKGMLGEANRQIRTRYISERDALDQGIVAGLRGEQMGAMRDVHSTRASLDYRSGLAGRGLRADEIDRASQIEDQTAMRERDLMDKARIEAERRFNQQDKANLHLTPLPLEFFRKDEINKAKQELYQFRTELEANVKLAGVLEQRISNGTFIREAKAATTLLKQQQSITSRYGANSEQGDFESRMAEWGSSYRLANPLLSDNELKAAESAESERLKNQIRADGMKSYASAIYDLSRRMTVLGDDSGNAARMLDVFSGKAMQGITPLEKMNLVLAEIDTNAAEKISSINRQRSLVGTRTESERMGITASEQEAAMQRAMLGQYGASGKLPLGAIAAAGAIRSGSDGAISAQRELENAEAGASSIRNIVNEMVSIREQYDLQKATSAEMRNQLRIKMAINRASLDGNTLSEKDIASIKQVSDAMMNQEIMQQKENDIAGFAQRTKSLFISVATQADGSISGMFKSTLRGLAEMVRDAALEDGASALVNKIYGGKRGYKEEQGHKLGSLIKGPGIDLSDIPGIAGGMIGSLSSRARYADQAIQTGGGSEALGAVLSVASRLRGGGGGKLFGAAADAIGGSGAIDAGTVIINAQNVQIDGENTGPGSIVARLGSDSDRPTGTQKALSYGLNLAAVVAHR